MNPAFKVSPRVQAFCEHGGDASQRSPGTGRLGACNPCVEKLLNERDQLREVLRDASEEQGFQRVAVALEKDLKGMRKLLETFGLASMYNTPGARAARGDLSPLNQAYEKLNGMLQLLSHLIRERPAPMVLKVPAEPCRVCGAPAGEACVARRHGAAWCYHSACGRLMRGGECDHCKVTPPMDEALLVPVTESGVVAYEGAPPVATESGWYFTEGRPRLLHPADRYETPESRLARCTCGRANHATNSQREQCTLWCGSWRQPLDVDL